MNDFLGQLIVRSLNQIPLIQPRLPTVFEPINGDALHGRVEPAPVAPPPLSAGVTFTPFKQTLLAVPTTDETDPVSPASARVMKNGGDNEPSPRRPSAQPKPRSPVFEPEPPAITPRPESAGYPDPPVRQATRAQQCKPATAIRPLSPRARVSEQSGQADSPVIPSEPVSAGAAGVSPKPVVHQRPTANLLRPALPMSPNQHTSPPPVIHVTIGRVDVRAILPAPQTRRTSPQPAPRLSLEDYLKRRNGEKS
jgi:hypothetical protein